MKKILVTGKNGQVGWELQRTLAPLGQLIAIDQEILDLANPDAIIAMVRDLKPDIIVNPAAYTAVDKAESERTLAMKINADAPRIFAEEAKRLGATFVHYSTDYVFDGTKTPYHEEDKTGPLNVYGESKLAGEKAVQAVGGQFLILRTSWVYGARGKNFLLTMLKLAAERHELKIVNDQIGAPTWSRLLAQATAHLLARCQQGPYGLYHVTNGGATSWQGFAEKIFELASQQPPFRRPNVIGIPTKEYPTPAKRPAYSILSNAKVADHFGLMMPAWDEALARCMQELFA